MPKPIRVVEGDITRLTVDAIVNAANSTLLGGGGVDGAIHRAAGPDLLAHCRTLGGCPTGEARITPAFKLPCRHVIHTVGPVWKGGGAGEPEALASCHREALGLAAEADARTIAFPAISCGVYGYPVPAAAAVAVATVHGWLAAHPRELAVTFVGFSATVADIFAAAVRRRDGHMQGTGR
ncbi:MAG: O-acetyl-ADP-ribose deacetylase [Pseudomonadota bacterium]